MFTTAYAAEAAWDDTFWKHDRFNEILVKARAETDEPSRAAMYAEMQQILHDDGGIVVLMFNNFTSVHSDKVAHIATPHPQHASRVRTLAKAPQRGYADRLLTTRRETRMTYMLADFIPGLMSMRSEH